MTCVQSLRDVATKLLRNDRSSRAVFNFGPVMVLRSTGTVLQVQGQSDIKEKFENRLGLTTAERSSPHRAEYKM